MTEWCAEECACAGWRCGSTTFEEPLAEQPAEHEPSSVWRQTPPSWICSLHVIQSSNVPVSLICRVNRELINKTLSKPRAIQTSCLCLHESISESLWSPRSLLSSVGYKIEKWRLSKRKRCQARSTSESRQMLAPEFVHWHICWIMLNPWPLVKEELHLSKGWMGNGVLHF